MDENVKNDTSQGNLEKGQSASHPWLTLDRMLKVDLFKHFQPYDHVKAIFSIVNYIGSCILNLAASYEKYKNSDADKHE